MPHPLLSRKMQQVYSVAERHLATIGIHPRLVKQGALGYFMTIENIKERIGSLDPADWYKNQYPNEEEASFNELPLEDQIRLKTFIEELVMPSVSQEHLEVKCRMCGDLAYEFGNKILGIK